jgi:pimeloyl-ACP methyl ester carboxylesterase
MRAMRPTADIRRLRLGAGAFLLAGAIALLSSTIDAVEARKVIYLHGRIVQDQQSARPKHPEWGYYELNAILKTLRDRGFDVTGEIRPKGRSVEQSADHVVAQVRALLEAGIPPDRITVVGGSMGASIALLASVRLQNPELRFAVLGACMSANVPALLAEHGAKPAGRFLSFVEKSDELSSPCPAWSEAAGAPTLSVREVVLETGQHHGFLYRPLPEWVEPLVAFAGER